MLESPWVKTFLTLMAFLLLVNYLSSVAITGDFNMNNWPLYEKRNFSIFIGLAVALALILSEHISEKIYGKRR